MLLKTILKGSILLLGAIYITLQGLGFEADATGASALMLVLIILLYIIGKASKSSYFLWFLLSFTIAHIVSYITYYQPDLENGQIDYYYYSVNLLYIISYMFLIFKIAVGLDYRRLFMEFSIPIFILVILDIFCVVLVTATTEGVLSYYEYLLELTYNSIIMVLLSVALLNYMYRSDTKSILFLMASICVVFSEIIQLAYFYVLEASSLGYIYSVLFVTAFILFYLQSQKVFTGPQEEYTEGKVEA